MNSRLKIIFFSIVISTLVVSCGGAGSPTIPTSTATPRPTAPPTVPPTATLDHGDIPSELVGIWVFFAFGRAWSIELTAEGTFSLYNSDNQLDVAGSYGVFGNEAIFRDETRGVGTLCVPAVGKYNWELKDDRLVFTVLEDKCMVGRIEQWTAVWNRK